MKVNNIKTEAQYGRANYYYSDGTGRDTYIQFDNGGLTMHAQRCHQPQIGSFQPKRNGPIFRPQSSNKTLHYVSDGSGRDKYVLDNHGGLMNTNGDRHWLVSFKQGLRTPERVRPRSGVQTPAYSYQQRICKRLSVPKYTKIPFLKQLKSEEMI
ncbi:unnamed protein product [Paramecium primaurelia]|uniref:Uncharacterized protein n=2 Tax=Paramecium TaxID=5884 RepID=A0A8S1WXG1_9CILI|nr:unnamed protein product [Paramecium primaurelia]CAD8194543.1 unnamed protein product [Paramecium pentaurelia]